MSQAAVGQRSKSFQSVFPITRFSALMSNGDDKNGIFENLINDAIWGKRFVRKRLELNEKFDQSKGVSAILIIDK